MSTLITNIGELVTNDPAADDLLGARTDAALVLDEGLVAWVGMPQRRPRPTRPSTRAGGP